MLVTVQEKATEKVIAATEMSDLVPATGDTVEIPDGSQYRVVSRVFRLIDPYRAYLILYV